MEKGYVYVENGFAKRLTFIAEFVDMNYGEPGDEEIVAACWADALQKALKLAESYDSNLISLKLSEKIVDKLLDVDFDD